MRYVAAGIFALLIIIANTISVIGKPPSHQVYNDTDFHPVIQDFSLKSTQPHFPPKKVVQPTPVVINLTPTDPKAYALSRVGAYQFSCLDKLWIKESNWNPTDLNHSSGAYGIPQALPGSKMAVIASDWRTNPITQVKWGLLYISQRYGTSCAAWHHSQEYNWY